MVNCDKRELEYKESLKDYSWCYTLPYDTSDSIIAKLEEKSDASSIPRISIYSVSKGYEKPSVIDIKQIILKPENMTEAVNQVIAKIQKGEENYDAEA